MPSVEDQIKNAQARIDILSKNRDTILRDVAVEERKLEEAYEKLRELGVEEPESKSSKELQTLAEAQQIELQTKLAELVTQLEQGEKLIADYNKLLQG